MAHVMVEVGRSPTDAGRSRLCPSFSHFFARFRTFSSGLALQKGRRMSAVCTSQELNYLVQQGRIAELEKQVERVKGQVAERKAKLDGRPSALDETQVVFASECRGQQMEMELLSQIYGFQLDKCILKSGPEVGYHVVYNICGDNADAKWTARVTFLHNTSATPAITGLEISLDQGFPADDDFTSWIHTCEAKCDLQLFTRQVTNYISLIHERRDTLDWLQEKFAKIVTIIDQNNSHQILVGNAKKQGHLYCIDWQVKRSQCNADAMWQRELNVKVDRKGAALAEKDQDMLALLQEPRDDEQFRNTWEALLLSCAEYLKKAAK